MAENGNGRATTLADFIWKNAEDLRGDFKHTDFEKIILPFALPRRLECVLEPMRTKVRDYLEHKDKEIGRVDYEINFNRFFYKYVTPRKLEEIDTELKQVEKKIAELLGEVTE
ncbi:putative type I restrictionmodification system DNA methylase [Leptospirillum ferrooxidans C2-3]|uniref:Putative type I restrictionmodification system DNA methylase n=1 Tax=Leptospirillum ferrooxidans (strain C2-3) TaxID=1162668 RepID=I0IMK0_LEPFC|nr:type I restriction-modification system subunit M N-terminal domain-containing protein [Leptospirillum ferrooxidans]BAM06499.1 putative type I restrictionmodification system DNA methylase [Leptospirillum ferrooxidans C2-3]